MEKIGLDEQVKQQCEKQAANVDGCYPSKHIANGVWDGRPVGKMPAGAIGSSGGFAPGVGIDRNYELRMRLQSARVNAEELERALKIVERYPDVLDLIWLLRSGLV
jgi:hypothetical protein